MDISTTTPQDLFQIIYDAFNRIVATNPLVQAIMKYTKRLIKNPVYFILFGCFIISMLTPVMFYMSIGFIIIVGAMILAVTFLGFVFGGMSIVLLSSASILYSVFLIFGAQVSAVVYILQRIRFVTFSDDPYE